MAEFDKCGKELHEQRCGDTQIDVCDADVLLEDSDVHGLQIMNNEGQPASFCSEACEANFKIFNVIGRLDYKVCCVKGFSQAGLVRRSAAV